VDDDVGAVLDGTQQVGGGERGVDRQRQAVVVGDRGHGGHVEHLEAGVAERLGEHHAGLGPDGVGEGLGVAGVDEGGGDAEPGHGEVQQVVAAAVDVAAGDHVVAGVEQGGHGKVECRLAAGRAHGTDTALEGGYALLEHGDRRVGDARVEVAADLQVEESGGVVHGVEHERRGLVDGHGPGSRGGVGLLACVQGACVESREVGFDHGSKPTT